jgi:hypothetical protein
MDTRGKACAGNQDQLATCSVNLHDGGIPCTRGRHTLILTENVMGHILVITAAASHGDSSSSQPAGAENPFLNLTKVQTHHIIVKLEASS